MTNSEKFKEVFGFNPIKRYCIMPTKICYEYDSCRKCPFKDFWDKEYTECFVLKDEYEGDE